MASKNWWVVVWVVVIACLLVIAAYHAGKVAGKFAGENSAEFRLREKELAFQKEKEATRKAEFAKLLRIYEEEKRANEKRRRHEKMEELDKEAAKRLKESQDRQMALYMRAIEMLMQNRHPQFWVQDQFLKEYLVPNAPVQFGLKSNAERAKDNESSRKKLTPTPTHGLVTAIAYDANNPLALIEGHVLQVGDTIHGVKIVKIHEDKVEFQKKDNTWTQKIGEVPKPHWE